MQRKWLILRCIIIYLHLVLSILGGVICVASILGIIGAYVRKTIITYVYLFIIICALVFQIIIGVRIYSQAANASHYLSLLWPSSSNSYRANLQNQVKNMNLINFSRKKGTKLYFSLVAVDFKLLSIITPQRTTVKALLLL